MKAKLVISLIALTSFIVNPIITAKESSSCDQVIYENTEQKITTSFTQESEISINLVVKSEDSATGEELFRQEVNTAPESFDQKLEDCLEACARFILGPKLFRISGYHPSNEKVGVFGQGEVSDKVRITLTNGILNHVDDHLEHLSLFSELHGGTNIHYVFRRNEGWSRDLMRSLAAKFGFISLHAEMLAQLWREMIAEMGGIDQGGKIIHYTHSIGGAETKNAKSLMLPAELKMIRVYTIASPVILIDEGFEKVINYVSKRDGICYLDPLSYFGGLRSSTDHIIYLDQFWGMPFVDHLLWGETYHRLIEQLGQEFLMTFVTKKI